MVLTHNVPTHYNAKYAINIIYKVCTNFISCHYCQPHCSWPS